jgi:stage IV sporulation protein FB
MEVNFKLFGIPVRIELWFWITLVLLGGGMSATTQEGVMRVLTFILAATPSILVHEFGHALTWRKFGGGYPQIVLQAFGGYAINPGVRLKRNQHILMILAGPGSGFALLILALLGVALAFSPGDAFWLVKKVCLHQKSILPSAEMFDFMNSGLPRVDLLRHFVWINFWWSLLNLLPMLPLDGGQIMASLVRWPKRAFLISIIVAAMAAVAALYFRGMGYSFILCLYFAYINYQGYKNLRAM